MHSLAHSMRLHRTPPWRLFYRTPHALCMHRREVVSVTRSSSSRPTPCEAEKLFSSPMVHAWSVNSVQETVISRSAISRAERIVTEADNPRSDKRAFYDSEAKLCLVCNARLEGSYSTHTHSVDHKPRIALLKRTIGVILTFLEQSTASPSSPLLQESDQFLATAGSKRFLQSVTAHRSTPTGVGTSCFHASYAESPLFAEDGVPSRALLYHCPRKLREFDLVDVILRRWWNTLHNPPPKRGSLSFDRLLSLSSTELKIRRWRVRYLLHFLKSRGVLRSCLTLRSEEANEAPPPNERIHRSETFERLEMVGDFVFKSLTPDRLHTVFPADEGGLTTELQCFERALDSNHGLLAIYDYLGLDDIAGCFLANNKAKADVVEAVIGELKVLLWSTEVVWGMEYFSVPGERATHVYLRALVAHTIAELGHIVLMWQLESTLRNCRDFILKHTVEEYMREKGNEHRAKGDSQGCDVPAYLPKYAPLPPLLAWDRRRPGVSLRRGQVHFSRNQPRDSIPPSPQDPFRRLAPTAGFIPEAILKHYSVGQKTWSLSACTTALHALCGSLTPSAAPLNSGETADALSPNSKSISLPLSTKPQPPSTVPTSRGVPQNVLRALVTANCTVIRN
ncbi:RNA editing complex protein MP67 [Leishmania tarentolae]|uniref:RNA editing complex protein MP67 n=1 Tax=Leishmania tarentolae TaxID=5689 RepID=A0A640L053_LEITA|nr:RNA editing complex protein MP67 [Leishmania tarentolae]